MFDWSPLVLVELCGVPEEEEEDDFDWSGCDDWSVLLLVPSDPEDFDWSDCEEVDCSVLLVPEEELVPCGLVAAPSAWLVALE